MKLLAIIFLFLLHCPLTKAQTANTDNKGLVVPYDRQYYCITAKELQIALAKKGYPVKVDNVCGKKTMKAVIQLTIDKGLPIGNIHYIPVIFPYLGIEPCVQ